MDEIRVLSPTAMLEYGFLAMSFKEGLRWNPHVTALDAGSGDPGAYYLGAGVSFIDRSAVRQDLQIVLWTEVARVIPVIVA